MHHLGVIVLHGLGGTPHSVLPITAAVHAAGYATVAPTLPGHGTAVDDLAERTWDEWCDAVGAVADELERRADGIAVIGQSMGGSIGLHLAATRPDVRGVATINAPALAPDPDAMEHLEWLLSRGVQAQPAGAPDIRDPDAHDSAYADLPVRSLLEMSRGAGAVHEMLSRVAVPVMVVSSAHDGVVDPANADAIAAGVSGRVARVRLPNSAHVAALDLDRELLCHELLGWLALLTE